MANVVTTHMDFGKDEIRDFVKKMGFSRAHRVSSGWVISSPALKLFGPKIHFASKHTSTGHKKRWFCHSWDNLQFKLLVGVLGSIKSGNVVTFLSNLASNSVTPS